MFPSAVKNTTVDSQPFSSLSSVSARSVRSGPPSPVSRRFAVPPLIGHTALPSFLSTDATTESTDDATTETTDPTTETGSETGTPGTTNGGLKLDVGVGDTTTGAPAMGCRKVDFLFVIDNSGSMSDEQQNLINSFPSFIQTIQDRFYVEQKERRFFATPLGMVVTDALVQNCPKIMDLKFTAKLEDELDEVSRGEYQLMGRAAGDSPPRLDDGRKPGAPKHS